MEFNELQKEVYDTASKNGFHENDHPDPFDRDKIEVIDGVATITLNDTVPRWLMLAVTELAEAMEAFRHYNFDNFKEELADTVIRIMDTAEAMSIDLESEIVKKNEINKKREYMHGGKRC